MDLFESYPLILDSMSEGVFTVDSEFRIAYFNRAAERIVGLSREEAVGKNCYEVFKADICQSSCALRATLTTGKPQRDVSATILNSRMKEVPVCVSTALMRDASGNMLGGVEVFQDMSDLEFLKERLAPSGPFHGMLGVSRDMRNLFAVLPDVAASEATVLIAGESGTGKELVARALHELSPRKGGPFLALNCAAFPDTLLESELFGYEKGAFTGAGKAKPGLFVQAEGGTLFLDEIGDISVPFQAKLLRVLEDMRVFPLGGTKSRKVDVRIVAATNRDLKQLMEEGAIRQDFFYRVSVIPVRVRPLRERREDILLLARHFLKTFSLRHFRKIADFTPQALGLLRDYDYPGNVRELLNIVERAVVLSHSSRVGVDQLPDEVREARGQRPRRRPDVAATEELPPLEEPFTAIAPPQTEQTEVPLPPLPLPDDERSRILRALEECRWNRTEAAARLKASRTTLWRKMKKLGLA